MRSSPFYSGRNYVKIRRGPKLEGYAFANFGYSSETDGESPHEMGINFGLSKCCALTCFWPDL